MRQASGACLVYRPAFLPIAVADCAPAASPRNTVLGTSAGLVVIGWLKRHGVVAVSFAALSTGDDATQLNAIAGEHGADVIVACKHGRREWPGRGTGSTAERLSRGCSIQVLLVVNPRQTAPARLLVALDDDDVEGGLRPAHHYITI